MRKRMILFALLTLILVFTGCGSSKDDSSLEDSLGKAIRDKEDLISSEDVSEEETEEEEASTESDETDSGDDTETGSKADRLGQKEEDDRNAWLSEHDIEIMKQNDFTGFVTATHNKKHQTDGEAELPATISISETKSGCEDGYKKVVVKLEIGPWPKSVQGFTFFSAPFDRYTGTEFREPLGENGLEMTTKKHSVEGHEYLTFTSQGKTIDIEKECLNESDGKIHTETTTVICPEDYDGMAFSVGYYDYELEAESDASGTADRIHSIDETPFFGTNGHDYYYFTYTDD